MKGADFQVANSQCRVGQHLQEYLKDRVPAWVPFKPQMLHQGFERQFTVGKGVERRVPAPSQQFGKGRIAGQVAPQGGHVEKISNQRLDFAGGSRSDGRPDNNILRAGIPVQQHLKSRQHGHKKGAAFARTQGPQILSQRTGDVEKDIRSMEGLERRPGPVTGQLQHRKRAAQLRSPEIDLVGIGGFMGDGLSLPQGKVGILHAQLGWTRISPAGEGPIKHIQLVEQQPDGQSIRHDVMKVDEQDVFGFTKLEQRDTNQRKTRQVERFERFLRGQSLQSVFALLAGQVIQFRDRDVDFELGMDELQGLAVLDGERRSQHLMSLNDFVEAVFQSLRIQRATKTNSIRHVIRRIPGRDLINHPHLALGKRKRGGTTIGPPGYFRAPDQPVGSPLPALLQQRLFRW